MTVDIEVPDHSERVLVALSGSNEETGSTIDHSVEVPVYSGSFPVNRQDWVDEAVDYLKSLASRASNSDPEGRWTFRISVRWSVPHNEYINYEPE